MVYLVKTLRLTKTLNKDRDSKQRNLVVVILKLNDEDMVERRIRLSLFYMLLREDIF